MIERPAAETVWRHKGSGELYTVSEIVLKFENPATGEWIEGVAYYPYGGEVNFPLYVRSLARFAERFEPAETVA